MLVGRPSRVEPGVFPRALEQIRDAELLRPPRQIGSVERIRLNLQDSEDVPPLPIGHLVAQSIPLELVQQNVLCRGEPGE